MPQITLSEIYDKRIAERLQHTTHTDAAVNYNYKFDGADAIHITSVDTMPMNDYQKSGSNRYGTPLDIGDTEQVEFVKKDRSFTGIIDKGDIQDQQIQKSAADCMKRQTDAVIKPEIEKYRLQVMAAKPGFATVDTNLATIAAGKDYVYDDLLALDIAATNGLAPDAGRVCFVTPEIIAMLLKSNYFVRYGNDSQDMLIKGQVGEVDGTQIIRMAPDLMPANCVMLLAHKDATTAVEKLQDLVIHENPVGYNGNVLEGRIRYDAFVLDTKIACIGAVYKAGTKCVEPTITYTAASTNTIAMTTSTSGATIKYTLDGSDPRSSKTAVTYDSITPTPISTATWSAANGATRVRAYATKTGNIDSTVTDTLVGVATPLTRI